METDRQLTIENSIVILTAAVLPDMVSILEQINISLSTWHIAIDLANAVFSSAVH